MTTLDAPKEKAFENILGNKKKTPKKPGYQHLLHFPQYFLPSERLI